MKLSLLNIFEIFEIFESFENQFVHYTPQEIRWLLRTVRIQVEMIKSDIHI